MFAATNRQGLYYKSESAWGETPSGGAFTQIRYTGETLDRTKNTAESEVIRSDRMLDELALLGFSVGGDINYELAYGVFDDFIEAMLCGTWTVIDEFTTPTLSLTVAAVAKTITRAAGSFVTDGVVVGAFVKLTGFANAGNNKEFLVTNVTATVLTVADPAASLVDEAGGGDEGYYCAFCKNGVVERSFVFEKNWSDINQFQWFNGCRLSAMDMDITAMQVIKGKFSVMGKDSVASGATVSGSTVAAAVSKLMSASANVASIVYNGVSLTTGVKSLKFTLENNLRNQDIVGQQATGGIGYGQFGLKGSLEAYFEDLAMLNNVINHDDVALNFKTFDADGNRYFWNSPKLKFTKGNPSAPGKNQDVMIPVEFSAIRDASSDAMMIVSRFPKTI